MKENFIKFAPLFSGLIDSDREVLAAAFVAGQGVAQATLLRAGERSEAIFLIGEGFASLTTQSGQSLATLGPGSLLGEASLLRMMPQEFDAVALSDVQYWKLSDRKLREIILHQPSIGIKLSQNFGGMLAQMEDYLMRRLAQSAELSHLPKNTLQAIASRLRARDARAGETLYRAGDMPTGLYVLENGLVELRPETSATSGEPSQTLEPGTLFGALALLTGKPYMQAAESRRDSLLWVLPAEEFHQITAQHPGLRRSLARAGRTRLGKADQAQAMLRLAQMPLFAEVPPPAMQAIVQRMVLQHIPAGERVYTMGEAGDALFLIEHGEVGLTGENAGGVVEELAGVQQGGFFGEMCLLTGQARSEDAMAVRNTNLWILYKSDIDELAGNYPAIGKALSQGLATRLSMGDQAYSEERFRAFELLEGLGESDLKQVAENLKPMRYRAGEQIYRAASAAETLFLLEKGTVRIQPLSGGTMLLGPGEAFGERALLTNQPHNATSIAETDVDVWTLSKQDFDTLMNRYPSLAISMSRILSQRLAQVASGASLESPGMRGSDYAEPVSATNMPSRRRRAAAEMEEETLVRPQGERVSFGQWFDNLTPFGKVRLALFVLLLLWLLGIAAPAALLSLIQGTSVASGADLTIGQPSLLRAISAVHAFGSYELASTDKALAQALAMADRMVPPTPVYTPMPTHTPIPTPTPTSTNTPRPTATFTATPPPVVQQFVAPPPTPTPVPVAQAAALPRAWDPRLDRLGVRVEEASVGSGQQYWRLIEARWWDENEAGGKHHIYVEVLDENGSRITGQPVTVYWSDGSHTGPTEDKAPPDYGYNYQMYAAGNAYNIRVEGLPSDLLLGAGMGDLIRPRYGIHTAFLVTYQKTTKP